MRSCKLWSIFNNILICFCFLPFMAKSIVNPEKTRIIFNEHHVLTAPETLKTPIIVSKPMLFLKENQISGVDLFFISKEKQPKDKESVCWLNLYQVPPNTTAQETKNAVILPLRVRLKIFVRPKGIGALTEEAGRDLTFKWITKNETQFLEISNPTPWHLSFSSLQVGDEPIENAMLAPKSTMQIPMTLKTQTKTQKADRVKITFSLINDDGNSWFYEAAL